MRRRIDRRAYRPETESCEQRIAMSWSSTPPAEVNFTSGNTSNRTIEFQTSGNYVATNSITRNEVDYRTFVAQRTGTYTFEARASGGSRIDPVAALYSSDGDDRLDYNDDYASGRNSRFTEHLTAGTTYVMGVTNYNRSPNGKYKVVITAPRLSAFAALDDNSTAGSATLDGRTLTYSLTGASYDDFEYSDHYIQVQILDLYGQPIHDGYWERGFRTAGTFVPGSPVADTQEWSDLLSTWDLSRASSLRIIVGTA